MADNPITDAVDKFQKLPTGGKVAVVGITAGVAVFGIIVANKRAASVAASGTQSTAPQLAQGTLNGGTPLDPTQLFSGSGLLGTPGTTDTLTANGPTQTATTPPTTTPTPTPVTTPTSTPPPSQTSVPLPAPGGTAGLSNNFHVITVGPGTQFPTLASIAQYAAIGTPRGQTSTWNPSSVFSYRNNSQIFQSIGVTANSGAIPQRVDISI